MTLSFTRCSVAATRRLVAQRAARSTAAPTYYGIDLQVRVVVALGEDLAVIVFHGSDLSLCLTTRRRSDRPPTSPSRWSPGVALDRWTYDFGQDEQDDWDVDSILENLFTLSKIASS